MRLIKDENIYSILKKEFSYNFVLNEDGLYLIEIIASAKSWWQNIKTGRAFFKDDDIFLTLDGNELTTSLNKREDSRSVWNGNELNGLEKTLIIAVSLKEGKHSIILKPDESPYVKSLVISKVEEKDQIIYIPTRNNPAQNSGGRPWMSFIILNLFINNLSITASADKKGRDDGDLKLLINGKIQSNENAKAHHDWYWCGKILDGGEKVFDQEINVNAKQYNLDLYSDGSPFISKIEVGFRENTSTPGRVPTETDPLWTGNFMDDPDEIILSRLVFGEACGEPHEAKAWVAWSVINRMEAKSSWPNSIHGVILQTNQYDPFKPTDPTFKKIINPLGFEKVVDKQTKQSWSECYDISQSVVNKTTKNPTIATHFHGSGVTREWFEKHVVPNGKFLKKIGNTSFYWSPN